MYYGRGAGGRPTASAVVADIHAVAAGTAQPFFATFLWPDRARPARPLDQSSNQSRYYLRVMCEDSPGVLAQIASRLGENAISISSVLQKELPEGAQPSPSSSRPTGRRRGGCATPSRRSTGLRSSRARRPGSRSWMSTPKSSEAGSGARMALVIIDGAADMPMPELGGLTPLEAAEIPAMDRIARMGRSGTVRCIPDSMEAGSDVAIMSVLGYDPERDHTGRAPIEAAARGVPVADGDWVFRCNLVTLDGDLMKDHSGGGVSSADAARLVDALNREMGASGARFYSGVSYRNLMVWPRDAAGVRTTPPHDILGQPFGRHLPTGEGSEALKEMIERSRGLFGGTAPRGVSSIWLWGQGKRARLEPFAARRRGLRGAMVCAVDLARGLGRLIGWPTIDVDGATGNTDTNFRGKGAAGVAALADYDLVCVHIEAPDEAGHRGEWREKVRSLEEIDRHIVTPLLDALARHPGWRILVMPDHPTPCAVKTHTRDAVPFALAGTDVEPDACERYSEKEALKGRPLSASGEVMDLLTAPFAR
jgi:2,3-bisphosphoglycerate-independent phosphoglycerate mutase